MTKYHISKSGLPGECDAPEGTCPLGGEHFTDKLEAVRAAEKILDESYEPMAPVRRQPTFHVGESGAVEVCENGSSCKVKPFGVFDPSHSKDSERLIGAAHAFREAVGKMDVERVRNTLENIPEEGLNKLPQNTQKEVRAKVSRSRVATDETTTRAREMIGTPDKKVTDWTPQIGDSVYARKNDPETGEVKNYDFTVQDPAKAYQMIQDLVNKGIHPNNIKIRTAASCHHSSIVPSFKDFDNVPKMPKMGDTRMKNGVPQIYRTEYGCSNTPSVTSWRNVQPRTNGEVVVDGRIMRYKPEGVLRGVWEDVGEADPRVGKTDSLTGYFVRLNPRSGNRWERGDGFRM